MIVIFDKFLPYFADAFTMSTVFLTIVVNVNVEIPSRSANAFCSPMFLLNLYKM